MRQDPHRLVAAPELWSECDSEHRIHYDDGVTPFHDLGCESQRTSCSYGELPGPDRVQRTRSTGWIAASEAYPRAWLIEAAIFARGGIYDPLVGPVEDADSHGVGRAAAAGPGGGSPAGVHSANGRSRRIAPITPRIPDPHAAAVSQPELPHPDVPLVVEKLLMRARRLADSGAPTEAVTAILDHVAALREGRG